MNNIKTIQKDQAKTGELGFGRLLTALFASAALTTIVGLSGCGGAATETEPDLSNDPVEDYQGPPPATSDVQAFKLNVWDNLVPNNRCGACHGTGGQEPTFVHQDDVNIAHSEAIKVTNLESPVESIMVTKVAGGHNCWLDSNQACSDILTGYIENWAAGSATGGGTEIELEPPPIFDAGASKSFPEDSALFGQYVHPLLTQYCAGCHSESSQTPQAPFFANEDVDTSYIAAKDSQKIDLDTPSNSRMVLRLRFEFHNCWSDCQSNADEMEAAITSFADQVPLTEVDPDWVISKALRLGDGILSAGGSRVESNVIAKWEFKTGSGSTVYDLSGINPAVNLEMTGTEGVDFKWVGGYGVEFINSYARGFTTPSKKIYDFIRSTGEYSLEAWVVPANVTQEGPARIISYSASTTERNFTLGQTQYNYDFLNRSSVTDANGGPALSTPDADEALQATQQHVVVTYDPVTGRSIYVNGQLAAGPENVTSDISTWADNYIFLLGDEAGSDGEVEWMGKLRLVAIHNRKLTEEQIQQNFEAGVGEKFILLFSIGDLIDMPNSYIMFEVSQFDSYSYLFNKPTFISLEADANPVNIPLTAMRIGINGKQASVGQSFRHLDTTLDSQSYDPQSGQQLSRLGTIIAVEKGPDADEFFLTFEQLGSHSNVVVEPFPQDPGPPADLDPSPDVGLRTFEDLLITMSNATGVSHTNSNVVATFELVKQQLPTVETIDGYQSSHQTAISQMAIEYCSELVDNTGLRSSYFPGFDFNAPANTAFDNATKRNQVFDPLITNMLGTNLAVQPDPLDVKNELSNLVDTLIACGGGCASDRTEIVVKATCSAVLGNAAILLQ